MAKNRNVPTAFNKNPPRRISIKHMKPFIGCVDKSVYGLTQIRPYYEPIRLKSGTTGHIFMEVFHMEFQRHKTVYGTDGKVYCRPYLIKSGFITDQHG